MPSKKLKLGFGNLLTILFYLFKRHEMGLVCHFKVLKTMLSEKIKLEVGPILSIFFLFVQKALKGTCLQL